MALGGLHGPGHDTASQYDVQLREAFEMSDRVQMLLSDDLKILLWNRAAERLYGYSADEVRGRSVGAVLQTVLPIPIGELRAARHRDGFWDGMVLHTAKDGTTHLSRIHSVERPGQRGAAGTVLNYEEIPDPTVAAFATVPAARRPATALAIVTAVRDVGGGVTGLQLRHAGPSPSFPIVPVDLQPDDLLTDIFPEILSSPLYRLALEVMDCGDPADFEELPFSPEWVGSQYTISGRIVPFGDGAAIRAQDVTGAESARRELEEEQERLRMIFEAAPLAAVQTDRDLRITWATGRAEALEVESMVGRPLTDGLIPESEQRMLALCEQVLADGRARRIDVTRVESETHYNALVGPRIDNTGDILGLTVVGFPAALEPGG